MKTTSKEESLAWAEKAFNKLKNRKEIKFRSKLEERVAPLLMTRGVSYEYESTKVPDTIQHTYTPDFVLPNYVHLEAKDTGLRKTDVKYLLLKRTIQN